MTWVRIRESGWAKTKTRANKVVRAGAFGSALACLTLVPRGDSLAQGTTLQRVAEAVPPGPAVSLKPFPVPPPPLDSSLCFDPALTIADSTEVWVKIHVHVYRDDSCRGAYLPWLPEPLTQAELYPAIGKFIAQANGIMSKLSVPWGDEAIFGIPVAERPAYLPLRYYLDGVSVHCDSEAQRWGSSPYRLKERYRVPDMLNLHFAEWVGKSNAEAEGIGGALETFTTEGFSPTITIHESLHLFGLRHAFEDDGIADTPVKRFQFDFNQDGDLDDYFATTDPKCPAVGSERQWRSCWVIVEDREGGPHYIDYDGDCVNDYTYTSVKHPCSSWIYQSNNILDYSGYNNIYNAPALTVGQVAKAMNNVAEFRCAQLERIGRACPPANPQLYVMNSDDEELKFFAGLSQNDARYRLSLQKLNGRKVYDTDWQRDTVPDVVTVTYQPRGRKLGRGGKRLRIGETYTATMTVANVCDEERSTSIVISAGSTRLKEK